MSTTQGLGFTSNHAHLPSGISGGCPRPLALGRLRAHVTIHTVLFALPFGSQVDDPKYYTSLIAMLGQLSAAAVAVRNHSHERTTLPPLHSLQVTKTRLLLYISTPMVNPKHPPCPVISAGALWPPLRPAGAQATRLRLLFLDGDGALI